MKLPTETLVEFVEPMLQTPMRGIAALFIMVASGQFFKRLRPPHLPSHRLDPVLVKRLLALLQGPTAAAATAAYKWPVSTGDAPPIMVWLARQPGAVAAAADLGLTAADVQDPAAAALLFSGHRDKEDA
jgi:hypothetical protein